LTLCRRRPGSEKIEGPVINYTKRAKLACLVGFDVEVKLSQYVPKDTDFLLWLNVAKSKMYVATSFSLIEINDLYHLLFMTFSKIIVLDNTD